MADFILTGDDFTYLADAIAQWLAYGVGLGAIFWIIGQIIAFIYSFVRF